ncbi:DUF1206 domain-containing protein [Tunicatimonas pelagia]|uniref:DUF1206 domain-containing protein n=1 Tax=Tunicatimonas pelagia TaxID=931531 RepID=UPI002666E82F|nr:DUF1206 domain-containing protein [Tunicatimonas pelagia]WKN44362.1 DUF1206 domain-containing protein [Tunicatimonas pelagia]
MNVTLDQTKDESIRKIARVGMFAKGVVYVILGVLTAMYAFGSGGQKAGKDSALKFVYEQPFGKVLLAVLAAGLICYVIWRFVQAFRDPEDKGDDKQGIGNRIGYAASGVLYGVFAYEAIRMLFTSGSSGSGGSQKETIVSMLLGQPFGQILVGIVAVVFFGKAAYQIYRAVSGKYAKKVKDSELDYRVKDILRKAGYVGYVARGIVIAIIGYFFLRAAIESNPNAAGGTQQAFDFIQSSSTWGTILLGIIAIGLACYGVFMFVKARYRVLPSSI